MEPNDIKELEDKLALIESNLRAIREYLDERLIEVQELSDEIMALVRATNITTSSRLMTLAMMNTPRSTIRKT